MLMRVFRAFVGVLCGYLLFFVSLVVASNSSWGRTHLPDGEHFFYALFLPITSVTYVLPSRWTDNSAIENVLTVGGGFSVVIGALLGFFRRHAIKFRPPPERADDVRQSSLDV